MKFKKSQLIELIKKEIREILSSSTISENQEHVVVGSQVTIPHNLTTDPINKQGKMGTVKAEDEDNFYIMFDDGLVGGYNKDIFLLGEVEDDKLEKRKEYNKELEKTKELMDDLTD